jgi:hypothetical protein
MQTSCSRAIQQVSVVSRKMIVKGMAKAVSSFKVDNAASDNDIAKIGETPGRGDAFVIHVGIVPRVYVPRR